MPMIVMTTKSSTNVKPCFTAGRRPPAGNFVERYLMFFSIY
jgi:hypothetical protein